MYGRTHDRGSPHPPRRDLEIAARKQDGIPVAVILNALHPWVHRCSLGGPGGLDGETVAALRS